MPRNTASGCCDVKPFPADMRKVKPYCGPFRLTDADRKLYDSIAQEQVSISGTPVDLYLLDIERSDKDPLYDEATFRRFKGPFRLPMIVSYAESNPTPKPEGFVNNWATSAWVARKELEDNKLVAPKPGDVLRVWKGAFFDAYAVDQEEISGAGYFFNIVSASEDGHIFDTGSFVGFSLILSRNTEFTPERRIEGR